MLKFINKDDYLKLTTCKQVDSKTIEWQHITEDSRTQGYFSSNTKWPYEREGKEFNPFIECRTLCPVYQPLDEATVMESLNVVKTELCDHLDEFAGNVRSMFAKGILVEEEYRIAEHDAKTWDKSSDVPLSIKVWADAEGIDYETAADTILTMSNSFAHILIMIRKIRLEGKAAIRASENKEEVEQLYKESIIALQQVALEAV